MKNPIKHKAVFMPDALKMVCEIVLKERQTFVGKMNACHF